MILRDGRVVKLRCENPTSGDGISLMAEKERACEQFRQRRQHAQQVEKFRNDELPAGSPIYFYCRYCGLPTEVLREDFVFPPFGECSQCRGLKDAGWLEDAISGAQ